MQSEPHLGYSRRINDPAFAKYLKNSNRWSAIFSMGLAVAAIIGFTIAGEMGVDDMENPQALFIGLGIGAMFLLIAFVQILGRKRSKTWDGMIADKEIKNKKRWQSTGPEKNDGYWQDYIEYVVQVKNSNGKIHTITVEDDDTIYNYYQIGDHVRHHGGLNSFEKYDKRNDYIIFCAACASLNDIHDEVCFRCKCPLLK